MRHLSLFSGSGIGTLAAQAVGITTVANAENDPACCYCLERLWPDARLFKDVRDVTADAVRDLGRIDIISGGFPCQDISTAGKGAGLKGERSGLWFEMARVIREVRPRWVLAENVPALRSRGADRVLADLEEADYICWPIVVGAWAVGAPHKRDRVWIVAHCRSDRCGGGEQWQQPVNGSQRPLPRNESPGGRNVLAHGSRQQRQQRADGNGVGQHGDEDLGHSESDRQRRQGSESGERPQPVRGSSSDGGELADSNSPRLPQPLCERSDPREEQQAAFRSRWPSRPGEPQHEWEAPRLVEFGLGDATDGLARRVRSRANKTLLRMAGNGWVYPLAVEIFRAIVELDRML